MVHPTVVHPMVVHVTVVHAMVGERYNLICLPKEGMSKGPGSNLCPFGLFLLSDFSLYVYCKHSTTKPSCFTSFRVIRNSEDRSLIDRIVQTVRHALGAKK